MKPPRGLPFASARSRRVGERVFVKSLPPPSEVTAPSFPADRGDVEFRRIVAARAPGTAVVWRAHEEVFPSISERRVVPSTTSTPTILHLPGFEHTRLTFRSRGRDFRLTDVHGRLVTDILT